MKSIIVFDTGTGGRLFAEFLQKTLNDVKITTVIDSKNAPYGNKTETEIRRLTERAIKPYVGKTDVIVLACNTATAAAIDYLRETYPNQVFAGFEPAVKITTQLSKTKNVVILTTNATKQSSRYQKLKQSFADINILEPNCSDWAEKIDAGKLTGQDIADTLKNYLNGVDVIVLACTHYVAVQDKIKTIAGSEAEVFSPFQSVSNHIAKVLGLFDTDTAKDAVGIKVP